jgi:hypothetical protein
MTMPTMTVSATATLASTQCSRRQEIGDTDTFCVSAQFLHFE